MDTKVPGALARLDETLNTLAALYQFRSPDEPVYGGLTVSQSYCLRSLYVRGPQSMGELAAGLGVRLSTMTGVVDQLEAKALARRGDHPEDRRSLRVELTPGGRRTYASAHEAFLVHLAPLFRKRSPAERERILSFLAETLEAIQGWRADVGRRTRGHGSKDP